MVAGKRLAPWGLALATAACHWTKFEAPVSLPSCVSSAVGPATVSMRFAPTDDFFAAPFPARGRVSADGTVDPRGADGRGFPATLPLLHRLVDLLPTDGYAVSAGLFFELSNAVDGSLLPAFDTGGHPPAGKLPPVVLFPLDDPSALAPIRAGLAPPPDGSSTPPGAVLLTVLPVQGLPLRENTDYALVVTDALAARVDGSAMDALCGQADLSTGCDRTGATTQPLPDAGLSDPATVASYVCAIHAASSYDGGDCRHISAVSVFHTGDPTATMRAAQALAQGQYRRDQSTCPQVQLGLDMQDDVPRCTKAPYCIYTGTVSMPQYQRGDTPYLPYVQWGGGWPSASVPDPPTDPPRCVTDLAGVQPDPVSWDPSWRTARVVVTIPRAPPPPGGYPTIVYVRTGAGTNTDPLVDRGPQLGASCDQTACRGPAEVLQAVGFAGITIDGPLVGESRLEPGFADNEDFSIFNFLNPIAMRDNLRQSALEISLVPDILPRITFDLGDCAGAGPGTPTFDLGHLALLSHSMGSSISPLALAGDPRYRAAILSGSGGSNIENVVFKANPVPLYVAGELMGLQSSCAIDEFPVALSLLQWATESSDSQVYARRMIADSAPPGASWWSGNARSILMIQGIVDHDILPPIADAMTLAEGLDLGLGPNSCSADPRCDLLPVYGEVASFGYPSLADLLPLSGRHYGALDAMAGNVPWPPRVPRPPSYGGDLTALVVQHRIDENREPEGEQCHINGHEVIYESTLARHQYACFLKDFAADETPRVRDAGEELAACDP
jgi:hypothetical protein